MKNTNEGICISPGLRYLVIWTMADGKVCNDGWSFDDLRFANEWAEARMMMYKMRGKRTMFEVLDTHENKVKAIGWVGDMDYYLNRRKESNLIISLSFL